jgi:hypothetical protein
MYLDDCIVHGKGEKQFLERLKGVLERFRFNEIPIAKKIDVTGYTGRTFT